MTGVQTCALPILTIVMVLHDINQAMQFSDNLIIMSKGCVHYKGNVRDGITAERLKGIYGINAKILWSEENKCPFMIPIVSGGERKIYGKEYISCLFQQNR